VSVSDLPHKKIKKQITSKQGAIDFATELSDNAHLYAAMLNASLETWNEYGTTAREHMATLNDIRMAQLRPLLLAVLNKFSIKEDLICGTRRTRKPS
jgi:hypothetical protein